MKWNLKLIFGIAGLFSLTLVSIICLKHFNSNSFSIEKNDYIYKLPVSGPSVSSAEMSQLQEKLKTASNDLLRGQLSAQLAGYYISEAKRSGRESLYADAEKLANDSLRLIPKNRPGVIALSKVLSARHEFAGALNLLESVSIPQSADVSALLATNQMALGRFSEAFENANSAALALPSIGTITLKALILSHLGQDDLAHHYFKRAIAVEDIGEEVQSVITRAQFATFLVKKGNYSDAKDLCDAALGILPGSAYAKLVKASAFNAEGNFLAAYKIMSSAFSENQEPAYLLNMVISLKLLERNSDFKILADEALKIYLEDVSRNRYGHLLDLAAIYYVRDDLDLSAAKVIEDQQYRRGLRGDLLLAKIYIRQGKTKDARQILENQIANGSTEPALFYLMVHLLNTEKYPGKLAELYYQRAKSANPDFNPDLLFKIP